MHVDVVIRARRDPKSATPVDQLPQFRVTQHEVALELEPVTPVRVALGPSHHHGADFHRSRQIGRGQLDHHTVADRQLWSPFPVEVGTDAASVKIRYLARERPTPGIGQMQLQLVLHLGYDPVYRVRRRSRVLFRQLLVQ